jgi:hypothetical protein
MKDDGMMKDGFRSMLMFAVIKSTVEIRPQQQGHNKASAGRHFLKKQKAPF